MSLPYDLGLDWSIERYGFATAWHLFWARLDDYGVTRCNVKENFVHRIHAMFCNGDVRGYCQALIDAGVMSEAKALAFARREKYNNPNEIAVKQSAITKWNPGSHYYVLGKKFDSQIEAERHLSSNGYISLGLRETFVYND